MWVRVCVCVRSHLRLYDDAFRVVLVYLGDTDALKQKSNSGRKRGYAAGGALRARRRLARKRTESSSEAPRCLRHWCLLHLLGEMMTLTRLPGKAIKIVVLVVRKMVELNRL